MKTVLRPLSPELAIVLGTDDSQKRYISIPRARQTRRCDQHHKELSPATDTALAMIEAALDRLDLGTFGLCAHCGGEINLKRLDHDPSVLHCQICEDTYAATAR